MMTKTFLSIFLASVVFVLLVVIAYFQGYETGQIDAINGEIYYELKTQDNGEVYWEVRKKKAKLGR